MPGDSMKDIYERSRITITKEDRERRKRQEKIKRRELKKKGIYQYTVCKIVNAHIGDISQFRDNLVLFSKENPFNADFFDDIRFVEPYGIYENLVRIELQIDHLKPFGYLGIVDVQIVEKNTGKAVISLKTAGELVQLLEEGYAIKLYDDAVDYLNQLGEWLQVIYGKAYKQKDKDIRPGVPSKPGYDMAFRKMRQEDLTFDEAFNFYLTNFQEEWERLENPRKAFQDAIRYRTKIKQF